MNSATSIIRILFLCRPSHWGSFIRQLHLLASNSSVLRNLKHITSETLLLSAENIISRESKLESNGVIAAASHMSYGDGCSSLWLPFDLILEDAMDGGQVTAFSAIEILTGIIVFFFVF